MSMKKATPKAVFEACVELDGSGDPWNRDDVRMLVGGGSFSVIDPLIQAWRRMQPVREVAPSLPAELLIQVAELLEAKVSGYIADVDARDRERESSLLGVSDVLVRNLQQIEERLSLKLDDAQTANHQLEAECARLESELSEQRQATSILEIKLQASIEQAENLSQQLKNQKDRHADVIQQMEQKHSQVMVRSEEKAALLLLQSKNEAAELLQTQLSKQKVDLSEVSEAAENRLMRLLDQSRGDMKELQNSAESQKTELLAQLQHMKQAESRSVLEAKALKAQLAQQVDNSQIEIDTLKEKLTNQAQSSLDFSELKQSLSLLHNQIKGQEAKGEEKSG